MKKTDDIESKVREMMRSNCRHFCHDNGGKLNPWVEECPVCGCENPRYDPDAVSDIVMPSRWEDWFGG